MEIFMSNSIASRPSLPPAAAYVPPQHDPEEPSIIYEGSGLMIPEDDSSLKKKSTQSVQGKTVTEIREEALASMHATLLKTISETCINMIEHHRAMLKKQYKLAKEEMEAIQRKYA